MEQKGMRRYVCKKALIGINLSVQWEPLKVFEQVKKLANIMFRILLSVIGTGNGSRWKHELE